MSEAILLSSDAAQQANSLWANPWMKTSLIVVGLIVVMVITRGVILRRLERLAAATDNDFDDRLVHFLRTFLSLILCFVAFLLIMQAHDKPVTTLLAGAGIAGIALGFAAQETLADILAGVFLILDRPMRVGDRVKLEKIGGDWGSWGDVLEVGLRRTIVLNYRTFGGALMPCMPPEGRVDSWPGPD